MQTVGGSNIAGAAPQSLAFDGTNQYASMVDAFARSVAAGALESPSEDGLAQMEALDRIKAEAVVVG